MFTAPNLRFTTHQGKRLSQALMLGLSLCCLSLLIALAPLQPSLAISVTDVPNPQQVDGTWVTDMAEMLSDRTEADLNQMISALETTNSSEIAVVTVPDTQGAASPKSFATELFNTWGIGKEGADNGVLFLISKGDRRNEIETGYGVEGLLPDAKLGAILDQQVTPQFRSGNFDAGVLAGTEAIVIALGGEGLAVAQPQTNAAPATQPLAPSATTAPSQIPAPIANNTHSISAESAPSIAAPKGETPTVVWFLLIGAITPVVIGIRPLITGKLKPLALKPTGKTTLSHTGSSAPYVWMNTWLPIPKLHELKRLFKLDVLFNKSFYQEENARLAQKSSWLAIYRRNKQLNFSIIILFTLLYFISSSTSNLTNGSQYWAPMITWCWLAIEFFLSLRGSNQRATHAFLSLCGITLVWLPLSFCLGQEDTIIPIITLSGIAIAIGVRSFQLANSLQGWKSGIFQFGTVLFPIFSIVIGLRLLASPLLLTVGFGFLAGLVRLLRASRKITAAVCTTCDRSMQPLPEGRIHSHLTHPELTEIRIGSKIYEGWHCPTCSPAEKLSANLVSIVLDNSKFKQCKTCKSLTLTTNSVTIAATYSSPGSRQITEYCHCCKEKTQRTIKIAQKSSGSSSSYSSGGYSGSSSGGSSGGSFGGGSSGGGGAGSSW